MLVSRWVRVPYWATNRVKKPAPVFFSFQNLIKGGVMSGRQEKHRKAPLVSSESNLTIAFILVQRGL